MAVIKNQKARPQIRGNCAEQGKQAEPNKQENCVNERRLKYNSGIEKGRVMERVELSKEKSH